MPIYTHFNQEQCAIFAQYAQFPLHIKLLHLISLGGAATAGQAYRWMLYHEPDGKRCFKTITECIARGYVRKLAPWQLKKIKLNDSGTLRANPQAVIFYLTEKGLAEMARFCPPAAKDADPGAIKLKHAKHGVPYGVRLSRTLHHLILVESVLYYINDHDFVWIKMEDELKSEFYRERERRKHARQYNLIPDYQPFPDYEIHVLDKQTGEYDTHRCEICVRMDDHQIAGKPGILNWFCYTEKKKAQIDRVLGARRAAVVGDVFAPAWTAEELNDLYYAKKHSAGEAAGCFRYDRGARRNCQCFGAGGSGNKNQSLLSRKA